MRYIDGLQLREPDIYDTLCVQWLAAKKNNQAISGCVLWYENGGLVKEAYKTH